MTYDELPELHNINVLKNLGSILEFGILSHDGAKRIKHHSVAMAEIQGIRAKVILPNKRKLHSYANLYINARNTMMYKRKENHRELCVIRVDKSILNHPTAIVTDQNACSDYVRFAGRTMGLGRIDKDTVFAEYWTHPNDQIATWRHRAAMCAEVLVLDSVPPTYIKGVYVSCEESKAESEGAFPGLHVVANPHLFFR
jgi:hypothetical protein